MKLCMIFIAPLALLAICPVKADTPSATPSPATVSAKADAPKPASDVAYPYTFTCVHCGMKITIHNAGEWKKTCEMCACGSTNADCAPKKK
jgi:hypothetical protein